MHYSGILQSIRSAEDVRPGEAYSLADIEIAPFVQRLVRIGLFGLVAARPWVNDWYARITSRPAYAGVMPPSGSEGSQPAPA